MRDREHVKEAWVARRILGSIQKRDRRVITEEPVAGCADVDGMVKIQRSHNGAVVPPPIECHTYFDRYTEQ